MSDSNLSVDRLQEMLHKLEYRFSDLERAFDKTGIKNAVRVTGSLELPTIAKLNLPEAKFVETYNNVPQVFSHAAIAVTLTPESYRNEEGQSLFLENQKNGSYWIVASEEGIYWLVPNIEVRINPPRMKSLERLFETMGDTARNSDRFTLLQPGRVTLMQSGWEWRLEIQGILEFGNVSHSYRVAPQNNNDGVDEIYEEMRSQVESLLKERSQLQSQLEQQRQQMQSQFDELSSEMRSQMQSQVSQLWQRIEQLERETSLPSFPSSGMQQNEEAPPPVYTRQSLDDRVPRQSQRNEENLLPKTGDSESTVLQVSPVKTELLHTLTGHENTVRSLSFAAWKADDRFILASGSFDKTVRIWHPASGNAIGTLSDDAQVNAVVLSPDGSKVVSGGHVEAIKLWDISTASRQFLYGHDDLVLALAMSSDGETLVSSSRDNSIAIWNFKKGEKRLEIASEKGATLSTAIAPNDSTLVAGTSQGYIELWNLETGESLCQWQGHQEEVWSVALSRDGQVLASSSADKTVKLWNARDGSLLQTLEGHSASTFAVAIHPSEQFLASASGDRTIKLWSFPEGKPIATLDGHSDDVYCLAFSPDGRLLASGSRDSTILVWKLSGPATAIENSA